MGDITTAKSVSGTPGSPPLIIDLLIFINLFIYLNANRLWDDPHALKR